MAQPLVPVPSKLRIKLKGVTKQQCAAIHKGPTQAVRSSFQLQDLQAAVAAFSKQGVNGLPGGVMLGPWNEEEVLQEHQYVMPSAPAAAQHPAAATYRVRKRRAVEAAEFSLADLGPQYVVWGRSKRRRSQLPKRLAKTSAQLGSSLQRVLASGAQVGSRRPPAAPTGSQPAQQQQLHHPVQSGAPREQHPQQQQQLQQPAQSLPQPASNQVKAGTPPKPQLQIDKQAAAAAADHAAPAAVDRQVAQPVQAQALQQQSKTPEEQQEQPAAQKQAPEAPVQQVSESTGAKEGQQQELPPPQPMQATTAAASETPADVHAKPAQKDEPAVQEERQEAQQVAKVAEPASQQPQSQQHAAQEQQDKQQVQPNTPSAAATTDTIASRLRGSKKAAGQQKAQPEELLQQQPAQQKQKQDTPPDGAPPTKKPRTSDKGTAGSAATPAPAVASDGPAAASPAKAAAAPGEAAAAKDVQTADKKPAAAKPAATAAKGAATGKATAAVKQEPAAKASPAAKAAVSPVKPVSAGREAAVKQEPAAKASPAAKAAVSPVKPVSAGREAQPVKPAAAAAAKTAAAGSKAGPAMGKQAAPAEAAPAAAQPAAAPEAAPAAVKPESPPSETSHQQPIAATVPQHMQQLQPPLQPLVPQLHQEQTAVSRDRSQCSLQAPAESPAAVASAGAAGGMNAGSTATPAVASAEYGAHATSGMAGGAAQHRRQLLELEASSMTPAALALGNLQVPIVPTSFKSGLPDRPFRDQDEACRHLDVLLSDARKKKHAGDARNKQQVGWDVHSLTYYAHSALEFLRYWDACHKALKQLQEAHLPVDVLKKRTQGLTSIGLLKQVSTLCANALQNASNCKGQDVQKQALRMLLERLCAICQLRHLHSQRENLQLQANLLRGTVPVPAGNGSGSSSGKAQQQQQQQQGQRVAPGRPPARAAPVASSGTSPGGKQAFNKRSPDDSNTSNQDRVQLSGILGPEHSPGVVTGNSPGGGSGGNGAAGASLAAAGGGAAASQERMLMVAESTCAEHLSDMLKITDGMHQTVMRMQQFLESPEVLADEDARAAALHISTLGLDAGMFSIPRVIAHAEAALVCVVRSGRRGMVRMAS